MGLIQKFTEADIKKALAKGVEDIENGIIAIFQYVGEKFVNDARLMTKSEGGFGDVTGNLRSSIGYFIFKNGEMVAMNMSGNTLGMEVSKNVAESVSGGGYELIGVAGMDYASKVEAIGYNVISLQADVAIVDLKRLFEKYQNKINNMIGADIGFEFTGKTVKSSLR